MFNSIKSSLKKVIKAMASLKITVLLLISLFLLVIMVTLAQVDLGIYYATQRYLNSFAIYWAPNKGLLVPIFPGGYTIGTLLFFNLVAALATRIWLKPKSYGLWLIHMGLLSLLIGSGITSFKAAESQLAFSEGESKYYSESTREIELVVIDTSGETKDAVISFPEALLKEGSELSHNTLPFTITLNSYSTNSTLENKATPGIQNGYGQHISSRPLPIFTQDDARNIATAIVSIDSDNYKDKLLLTTGLEATQVIQVYDTPYRIELRHKRYYVLYSIQLIDFQRKLYPGTEIPHSFSSKIKLNNKKTGEERDVLIYMNHPFRYEGKTYFQASYGENETLSVLQVVENPGWLFPYISSTLISLGLLIHFLQMLIARLKKDQNHA